MNVQFVTGADDRVFLQTLILLQSFANAGAADAIKVCDFGFTPGQRLERCNPEIDCQNQRAN